MRLITAGPPKRMIGCTMRWLGVYLNTYLANQVIPVDKAIKAIEVLGALIADDPGLEFHVHR